MVHGLTKYKEYFANYSDSYVIIGGTACDIIMNNIDLDFRATKDFDIVLIAEISSRDFYLKLWQFINDGEYINKQKSSDKQQFYRFTNPKDKTFPVMIEFFSRKPLDFEIENGSSIIPIPIEEDISSLSAILLNEQYYNLLLKGKYIIDGISLLREEYIILFKIKAWLDLKSRKENGEKIDSRNIKKHKNDIFRLLLSVTLNVKISVNAIVLTDILEFINYVKIKPIVMKDIKITTISFNEALNMITEIYVLDEQY